MLLKACEILELLSKTPGRLDKEKILRDNKDNEELKFLFETAFNPYLIYGVKDFEVLPSTQNIPTLDFLRRLRKTLVEGEVTGGSAKGALELTLSSSNELSMKWLEATFKKNIKCGVDTKTINKIWPKFIPEFEIALCNVLQSSEKSSSIRINYDVSLEEFKKQLKEGNWVVEPKMDGLRCITIIDEQGSISFLSRSGREIYNLDHIEKELKNLNLKNTVLDGEMMARDWNESISIARSEKNTEGKNLIQMKYYLFDMLTLEEWSNKKSINYLGRQNRLIELEKNNNFKYLVRVVGNFIRCLEGAISFFNKYLEQGFEGVVFKNVYSSNPFKRDNCYLKWKPFYSEDLVIVGYEEGKNKNKGRLGKFYVDYKGVKVGVGGGYKEKEPDNQRRIFWEQRDQMIGKIIEVKHYGITSDNSLKYPQFLRVREDK